MMDLILSNDGINWVWYCHVTITNGFATVSKEYRLHKYDDENHPKTNGRYRIREKDFKRQVGVDFSPRIAIGIEIDGKYYPFHQEISRWDLGK